MLESLSQIALALLGTIGLVLLLGYIARRMQLGQTGDGRELKIVETLHLGSKERVFMLQVGSRRMLVGVTGQQITALGDVPPENQQEPFEAVLGQTLQTHVDRNLAGETNAPV